MHAFTFVAWLAAIGGFAVALAAYVLHVRPFLRQRGEASALGVINVFVPREIERYRELRAAEGGSLAVYRIVRTAMTLAYAAIPLFLLGVWRGCRTRQEIMQRVILEERIPAYEDALDPAK